MAQPNSRDLEAFLTVAEELSFRRAAERLFLDQSALSRRVQNLEETLGYQLVFRTTREVMLTEAGRVFYEEVRPAMNALLRAGEVAKKASEGKTPLHSSGAGGGGRRSLQGLRDRPQTSHLDVVRNSRAQP